MAADVWRTIACHDCPARPGRIYGHRTTASRGYRCSHMATGKRDADAVIVRYLILTLKDFAVWHGHGHRATPNALSYKLKSWSACRQGRIVERKDSTCITTGGAHCTQHDYDDRSHEKASTPVGC